MLDDFVRPIIGMKYDKKIIDHIIQVIASHAVNLYEKPQTLTVVSGYRPGSYNLSINEC